MARPASVEESKLVTSFESIRRTLLQEKQDQRLEKPLAYWALPNDRRLPLALLDQSLKDLLSRPFEELSSTPGIGQKKMGAMIKLLLRAANDQTHQVPFGISELVNDEEPDDITVDGFDASTVSESQWSQWTQTVSRHRLRRMKLGRLASSLQELPTVIWDRPLGYYMEYSVAEIRRMKTHGEKRVRIILEIFHEIHRLIAATPPGGPVAIRLLPRFAHQLEHEIAEALSADELLDADAMRKQVVSPLMRQTRVDLGDAIQKLCEGRVGMRGRPQGVKAQSRRVGVTRARVYQLLDECAKAFAVRWPEGRCHLTLLSQRYHREDPASEALRLLDATKTLFFPQKFEEKSDESAEAQPA